MMDYREICLNVCDLARRAGAYIAEQHKTFTYDRVEYKGAQNLVSYVDKQTEKMIVEHLKELTPEAGFITEEGTESQADEKQSLKWIIDPLDGTTNFVHGFSPYCVSIALQADGQLVLGVIYEVTRDELFYAWRGSYAYLNGIRIQVSKATKLENSLIAFGFSYELLSKESGFIDSLIELQNTTNGIRRVGSAAADLAYLACGRCDAFFHAKLSPWDVAAGALIAQQAGARVTDYSGGNNYLFGRQIIACTPAVYDEFRSKIR